MTFQDSSLEPGVLCRSIPKASPPLSRHSIPIQQPIKIQIARFEFWFISRPKSTPDRVRLPTVREDNFSGFGLSSPALQQPSTKPFSGSPSKHLMTDPLREAREAGRQRPGIVYLLSHAARPDTLLAIDAALPEAAALN